MTNALVPIKGETPQIITIEDVKPFFDPATGERDYELTRQQARQLLHSWQQTLGEDQGGFIAMPDHFTLVRDAEGGEEPRQWDANSIEVGAAATFALKAFPFPDALTIADDDLAPVRRITDEAAMDRIARLFNREGDSAADFVDYLGEVLTATGRHVRP